MEYTPLNSFPYYKECVPLIEGLGFQLVELRIIPAKTVNTVRVVIARKSDDETQGISVNDCAKVHRLIQPRLEALISSKEVNMEVTSPGMERNIKNAAEFALFVNQFVRVWDTEVTDWVPGKIVESSNSALTLELESGEKKEIDFNRIAKAKLLNT